LMGDDEAATVKALSLNKNIIAALIGQHRGRLIDCPGSQQCRYQCLYWPGLAAHRTLSRGD
jgi:hypothetical protein